MRSPRSSTSTVLSVIALVVALCVTSLAGYAAGKADGDSVIKKKSLSGNRLKADTLTGKQVAESSLGKVPAASTADTVPSPPLNAFDFGAGFSAAELTAPGWRKDASGFVHLQGSVYWSGPDDFTMATLPPGARPLNAVQFALPNNLLLGIAPSGEIGVINYMEDADSVNLNGAIFYAGP